MRYLVLILMFLLSSPANCTSYELPLGNKLRNDHVSPFAPGELSGGKGAAPDHSAVQVINEKLRPFRGQKGALGFLEIGNIFAVDKVVVCESFGGTEIKTAFSFSDKQSRTEVLQEIATLVQPKKSLPGLKTTACVQGSYWYQREGWGYEACYEQDADGNWIMTSYHTWRINQQEP